MLKVSVSSCTGKMGLAILESAYRQGIKIVSAISSPSNKFINQNISKINSNFDDIIIETKINNSANIAIDFSTTKGCMENLKNCYEFEIPLVIGTTGFNEQELNDIKIASKKIPILLAPNTSIGINLLYKLIDIASKAIKTEEVHITDIHHNQKKDSPSGTAKQIIKILNSNDIKPDCSSIRMSSIIGEHSVLFGLPTETIEITHKAINRSVFADGAITAAKWLINQNPGLYSMADVLK